MGEEAVALLESARRLNPRLPPEYLLNLGRGYYFAGRYDDAIDSIRRGFALRKRIFIANIFILLTAYGGAGRIEEGKAFLQEFKRRQAMNLQINLVRAEVHFIGGLTLPYKNPGDIERMMNDIRKVLPK